MKDGIDYMRAEMEKADPWAGLNTGFAQGWRSALEAAHAKASAGGEAKGGAERVEVEAVKWANLYERAVEVAWGALMLCEDSQAVDDLEAELEKIDGDARKEMLDVWRAEAEARRVSGFGETP